MVDDGSHQYEPSKTSLNVFLPMLREGGLYVIEDWAWAHWPDEYHQAKAASGEYGDQANPLTKLIFETAMLAASRPGIISEIELDSSRAFLTRGPEQIGDPNFDISQAYLTSLWKMEFSPRSPYVMAARRLWRTRVPLRVRKQAWAFLGKR